MVNRNKQQIDRKNNYERMNAQDKRTEKIVWEEGTKKKYEWLNMNE